MFYTHLQVLFESWNISGRWAVRGFAMSLFKQGNLRVRGRGAKARTVHLGGHTGVLGLTEEKKKWGRSEQESKNVEQPKSQGEECRY